MDETTRRLVIDRAGNVCEYCRLPQSAYPVPFEIDHVIAKQHGGTDAQRNLALACLHCNGHKGPNLSGIDPLGSQFVPVRLFNPRASVRACISFITRSQFVPVRLFNPRRHKWSKHFRSRGGELHGRTAIGRATIVALALNDPVMVALREELIGQGLFPPEV
jgi:hypothetical protein